jgi:hypothetical protein
MELILKSDFKDWYDHAFPLKGGKTFQRDSKDGIPRSEMFDLFRRLDLRTPRHGLVHELAPQLIAEKWAGDAGILRSNPLTSLPGEYVVVYLDDYAHTGEGKLLLTPTEAMEKHPFLFCSEFVRAGRCGVSESWRYLKVGARSWWLKYWSNSNWRSNCGEGGCEIISEETASAQPSKIIKGAMWAIDYVPAGEYGLLAVDYNTAPGLKPLQDVCTATEIYELLKEASA